VLSPDYNSYERQRGHAARVTLSRGLQASKICTMSDKQVFVAIVGGLLSALLGGLLIVPITLLAQTDGGDDGWGLLWIVLMIVSGVTGLIGSAKWARKHISD
jgi:hypothetical protein